MKNVDNPSSCAMSQKNSYSSTMLSTPPPPSSLRGGLKILEEPLLGEGEGGVGIRNFYLGEGDILLRGANFVGGVT